MTVLSPSISLPFHSWIGLVEPPIANTTSTLHRTVLKDLMIFAAFLSTLRLTCFITAFAITFTAAPFVLTLYARFFPPLIMPFVLSVVLSNPGTSEHTR